MKKFTTFLFILAIAISTAMAQAPQQFKYQAALRDADGTVMANEAVTVEIAILQGSTTGSSVFSESHDVTTTAQGIINLNIGSQADLSTVDWSTDTYFIQITVDGTVMGVSQLLSVPYAMYAKTAEIVTETDPVYTESEAVNISATDITNLDNLTGTNTGDQDISGIDTNEQAIQDTAAQIRSDIPDVSEFLTIETDPSVPTATQTGEMQYWNGSEWITVPAGSEGQILSFVGGVPTWKTFAGATTVGPTDVYNPATGRVWMDRNLGASQVATSTTDVAAYGDLYQWGRAADGHESRTSNTTTILSNSDIPGHDDFILPDSNPYDWRSPQNDNLWQGINGTNNPCPSSYRLPTEAEWGVERANWSGNDAAGAFASPLKLPSAGSRTISDGSVTAVGSEGSYWSSTVDGNSSFYLYFSSSMTALSSTERAYGKSVRCIKDQP